MLKLMSMRVFVVVCMLPLGAWAAPGTPMATLKSKNGEVEKVLRQKVEKGSTQEKKQKEDIKQLAANLLDYDELAKRSLAQHWAKLNPGQQKEFVSTLRELIERNYVKQLRTNLDYQVQYKNNLLDATWTNLGSPITANNATASYTDTTAAGGTRFYRIVSQ